MLELSLKNALEFDDMPAAIRARLFADLMNNHAVWYMLRTVRDRAVTAAIDGPNVLAREEARIAARSIDQMIVLARNKRLEIEAEVQALRAPEGG